MCVCMTCAHGCMQTNAKDESIHEINLNIADKHLGEAAKNARIPLLALLGPYIHPATMSPIIETKHTVTRVKDEVHRHNK